MIKRSFFVSIVLSFLLVLCFGVTDVSAADSQNDKNAIKVILDGKYLTFDVPPVVINERTLVPLRTIFEALGATIEWDGSTNTVTGTKGTKKVILQIDNPIATVNGNPVELSAPGTIVNNKTMVPARFIAESMDAIVSWDEGAQTVIIVSKRNVSFADKDLETEVRKAIKKTTGDVTTLDLAQLSTLYIKDKSISSLEGLQYCINLKDLQVSNGKLSDISSIKGLVKLKKIDFSGNEISDISSFSNLTNLEAIYIGDNKISSLLPISNLKKLQFLSIYSNPIMDISPLSKLSALDLLNLSDTLVMDIKPLARLTNLTLLNIGATQVCDISPIKSLTKLTTLNLLDSSVLDITPLKSLKNLTTLYLENSGTKTELTNELYLKYSFTANKAKDIISKVIQPGMSDLEKELALHDYIITHTKYDEQGYINGTVSQDAHSPYGVLMNGVGVCDGYAYTMKALLHLVNVESLVVYGKSFNLTSQPINHAWNLVKIDGQYYHTDLTWDDLGSSNNENKLNHSYLNLSDKQIAVNHKFRKDFYPSASKDSEQYNRRISENHQVIITPEAAFTSTSGYLYKINTETALATKLIDDEVFEIALVDQWIYYTNASDSLKIYKIKTDGTGRTKLNDDTSLHLTVIDSSIYYVSNKENSRKIWKMNLDGSSRTSLNSDDVTTTLYNVDNVLYFKTFNFSGGAKLYKMKTDGSGKTILGSDKPVGFTSTSDGVRFRYDKYEHIVNEWIYYINESDENRIYRMKLDGTDRAKVSDDKLQDFTIEVLGNWIYYKNSQDNKNYKVKIDGTQRTLVE